MVEKTKSPYCFFDRHAGTCDLNVYDVYLMCLSKMKNLFYNIISKLKGDFNMKKLILERLQRNAVICYTRWCFRCGGTGKLGNEGCYYCQGSGVIDE